MAPARSWSNRSAVSRTGRGLLPSATSRPMGHPQVRRVRMMAAVARQGFELCGVRDRPTATVDATTERPLEPLLPGFLCASAAMGRVVDQIQRLQGNDLTVLITGESGTGKELVARAIHVGSSRNAATFLPYNCTTTTRELADSQLFGHRRGSFTGAMSDQPGLIRTRGRRHAVPGRGRRLAAGCPAEVAALPRAGGDHAGRREPSAAGRRPRARRHQCGPRTACCGGQVPRRSLLPVERHPDPCPAASPTPRGSSAPHDVLPSGRIATSSASPTCNSAPTFSTCSPSIGGPATSANCEMSCSARSRWHRRGARSGRSTCRRT